MTQLLEDYLNKIDKYLKPLPASERNDIICEIKSQIMELQSTNGLSPEDIIARLGNPKELSQAYLGEYISKNNSFNWYKLKTILVFYCLAGLSGLFILPCGSILSVALMFSGILSLVAGIVKLIASLFGFDIPIIMLQIGSYTAPPFIAFVVSVLFGLLLFWCGKMLWQFVINYIRKVSETKKTLLY